jgi:leucyl/phenylalanyl-tRNA--protein transferase
MKGEELTPWLIRYAYEQGVFPMTVESGDVEWFQPYRRALFPISGMHVSHSLRKVIRRGVFEISFDTDFRGVMSSCLRPDENWISEEFVRAYGEVHDQGWGHSVECRRDGRLVGGAYGVVVGSCFSAESMFHREPNASKVALWALIEKCRELGFTVFDAQVMNPHLRSLGAYEVPHDEYLRLLDKAARRTTAWSAGPWERV